MRKGISLSTIATSSVNGSQPFETFVITCSLRRSCRYNAIVISHDVFTRTELSMLLLYSFYLMSSLLLLRRLVLPFLFWTASQFKFYSANTVILYVQSVGRRIFSGRTHNCAISSRSRYERNASKSLTVRRCKRLPRNFTTT